MSTATALFFVFVAIYLIECCRWLPHASVVFMPTFGRWRNFSRPSKNIGSSTLGLILPNPLLPHRPPLVTIGDQFAISPEGVAVRFETPSSTLAASATHLCPWSQIGEFRIRRRSIVLADRVVARFPTAAGAARTLAELVSISAVNSSERERLIIDGIAGSFDLAAATRRIAEFESTTQMQAMTADLLLFSTLMLFPALAFVSGFASIGIVTVAIIGLLCLVCAVLHYRSARLWPGMTRGDALIDAFRVGVYPPAALRSLDTMGERLVETYHPLTIAAIVCPPAEFQKRASEFLRYAEHDTASETRHEEGVGQATRWYKSAVSQQVRLLLESKGLTQLSTSLWIGGRDPHSKSYCPRCGRQYTITHGICNDCVVSLVTFE